MKRNSAVAGVAASKNEKEKKALISAQNTIREKFRQLHNKKLNLSYRTNEEFKPIIQPLKKLVDNSEIKKEKEEVENALQKEIKKQEPNLDMDMAMRSNSKLFKEPRPVSVAKAHARKRARTPASTHQKESDFYSAGDEITDEITDEKGARGGFDISGVQRHATDTDDIGSDENEDEPPPGGDYLADVSLTAMHKPPMKTPHLKADLYKNPTAQLVKEIKEKTSPHLDTMYGFHTIDNVLHLGNDPVKVKGYGKRQSYEVRGRNFPATQGLTSLLMNNDPRGYNENDLKNYKEMLVYTSAHKEKFRHNGQINRYYGNNKYNAIIKGLFPPARPRTRSQHQRQADEQEEQARRSGGGMQKRPRMNYKSVNKSAKFNYTYWDDPNELVNRLRILIASHSAGHTGHENEIISIIEELREAKIIKYKGRFRMNIQ